MFCVAKVACARALHPPARTAAAADIEKARRVNTLLSSVPLTAPPNTHRLCGFESHASTDGKRRQSFPAARDDLPAAGDEKEGRYVIVTPINSLYATDEIFGLAGV